MDVERLESVPTGTAHLDTVRTLHQTVVSLRTALEISKNELKVLKEKYEQQSNCLDHADVIEKLTLENHILRRRIINVGLEEHSQVKQVDIINSVQTNTQCYDDKEVTIRSTTSNLNSSINGEEISENTEDFNKFGTTDKLKDIKEEHSNSDDISVIEARSEISQIQSVTSINEQDNVHGHLPSYKTKLELQSKFDVKIKVRTVKEGSILSSSTSDSDSNINQREDKTFSRKESYDSQGSFIFEEKKEHFDNIEDLKGNKINYSAISTENIKMAVPNEAEVKSKTDKFDVQVRITSEENLIVKETMERVRRKDTLNLDVDDLSLR